MFERFQRYLLNADGGEGGGNTNPNPAPDPTEGFKAALKKHGDDASAMARQVYTDNERLRSELSEAKGKLPKTDAVILSKEDGELFGKYKALGELDSISTRLAERDTFDGQLKAVAREKLTADAAKAHDFDPEVLSQMPGFADLEIRMAKVTKAGKETPVAHVITKDEAGKETTKPLDEYAKATWPKLLGSLKVAKADLSTPSRRQNPTVTGTMNPQNADRPRQRLTAGF